VCCSLGCGIGYGYLHRIPIRGSPVLPASHNPSRPVTVPTSSLQSPVQQAAVATALPTREGHLTADAPLQPVIAAQEMVLFCYVILYSHMFPLEEVLRICKETAWK
jgi:hypothetical protein